MSTVLSSADLDVLKQDYKVLDSDTLYEVYVTTVRGNVRLQKRSIITPQEVKDSRERVENLEFPPPLK